MLDRETRRQLSELARRGRQAAGEALHPSTVLHRSDPDSAPPASVVGACHVGAADLVHGPLHQLLPGEVRSVPEGEYYELRTPVSHCGDWAAAAVGRWLQAARRGEWVLPGAARGSVDPGTVLFMDTETTGLGNEPLFLVGLLSVEQGLPMLTQLLARDYAEEAAVLAEAARRMASSGLLVTYNGAQFDLPYVRNRLRYHRLRAPRFEPHLDLLRMARSRLRRTLGDCRLQTLERHLCGRERVADIPGAEIPQAYHDFVADGDACRLRQIVMHNSLDLITLAELAAHLLAGEASSSAL